MGQSEREHPRYAHEAAITLHVGGAAHEGGAAHAGRTNNVSRGGLCALLADAIPTGTEVEVDLQLVFDEETHSEPLRIPARVAWCTTVDDAFQIGLAFKVLTPELTKYLSMFLRYLDDGSAAAVEPHEPTLDDRFG